MMKTKLLVFVSVVFMALPAFAGKWANGIFTNSYGARQYQVYVPDGYRVGQARPLVVALHGCKQSPEILAGLTRLNQYADRHNLLVLYPAQAYLANTENCWNWFFPFNQMRAVAEPSIVMGMVDWVNKNYSVDRTRTYVFGLSAGAHMASTLLACYADVFAAGMIASGGMFRAAQTVMDAYDMRKAGSTYSPQARGEEAYRCSGSLVPRQIPVLVFQGADDPYNNTLNSAQAVQQFAVMNDLGDDGKSNGSFSVKKPREDYGRSKGGKRFAIRSYFAGRKLLMQDYLVEGMGHAWSGGDPQFPFSDPLGPNQTEIMLDFFSKHRHPGPTW